ncbi:MAG: glycosyltransferase family 39 protein, partial [Synergistales bacterium]|nr:glycosyltransferase family 39 protein [Synergistales bacterium]
DSGPIGQRFFIVLQDCHPSVWPITAEIIASLTNSSLVAIRLLSTLAFAVALLFLYLLARNLSHHSSGLALASLWAVSFLAVEYAGLARMYACAMAALAAFLYVFLQTDSKNDREFGRLVLFALIPVSLEWFTWPAVYTLLAVAIYRRWNGTANLQNILNRYRALIPFVIVCTIFFCYYLVLAKLHPSRSPEWSAGHGPHPAYEHFVDFFATVGPLSFLAPLEVNRLYLAVVHIALFLGGILLFAFNRRLPADFRVAVLFLTAAGLILPTLIRMLPRHYMLTLLVPLTFSYWAIVNNMTIRLRLLTSVLLLVFAIAIANTQERLFGKDNPVYDFPEIARTVKATLDAQDKTWVATPYQLAMCIYRYADLPEPQMPTSKKELQETLNDLPCGTPVVVLAHKWTPENLDGRYKQLFTQGEIIRVFPSGITVFRIKKPCSE